MFNYSTKMLSAEQNRFKYILDTGELSIAPNIAVISDYSACERWQWLVRAVSPPDVHKLCNYEEHSAPSLPFRGQQRLQSATGLARMVSEAGDAVVSVSNYFVKSLFDC